MAKTLYDIMDWPDIETIIYSESDEPHKILGAHKVSRGLLVQAFFPDADQVSVKLEENGRKYPMERMEEPGFFAVLLPKQTKPQYTYVLNGKDGTVEEREEVYQFDSVWEPQDTQKFNCGIYYHVYEKMGAVPMTIEGLDGVLFSVWAPNAVRVSVVGTFNHWDGRCHQMRRLWDSGIFELFIPGVSEGTEYKFELKLKGNQICLKTDPYAHAIAQNAEDNAIVTDLKQFQWEDSLWREQQKNSRKNTVPINIYQVHLNSFLDRTSEGAYLNYRELADRICGHVKKLGYTHIQLLPVMEYHREEQLGYQTFGYYAPTGRFGSPEDFQYFVNRFHIEGIGVFLEWTPIFFENNANGLRAFDGTCLYEHADERQGYHKQRNAFIFNYARGGVKNFLIANALFWEEYYHIDGIAVHNADAVLYLDYNKELGEWLPNMYGGNENLDGIEFFRHLNSIVKKECPQFELIAQEKSGWPDVTRRLEDEGLGFDWKWNDGWVQDILPYLSMPALERSNAYSDMLMSMVYMYREQFILPLSWESVCAGQGSFYERMQGNEFARFAAVRLLYGYQMVHPGKKLLFMGQEFAQDKTWNSGTGLLWEQAAEKGHAQMMEYVSACNQFYRSQPALYELDDDPEGFEWINQISADENITVFLRKSGRKADTLLILCNFVPLAQNEYKIGVPFAGTYREILNSDAVCFGGSGFAGEQEVRAKKDECDGREYSVRVKIAPLSISIFRYETKTKDRTNVREQSISLKDDLEKKIQEAEALGDIQKQKAAAHAVAERKK